MGLYHYADVMIDSVWSLNELSPVGSAASYEHSIAISLLDVPPCEPEESGWIHNWPPERGGLCLALIPNCEGFFLHFPRLADFVISIDGRHIAAWTAPSTRTETSHHLLLDQVLPRVLAQQGRLVLHAGAVRVGDQAIGFIGGSGSGKSTLTASLHDAGYPLLCDDGLVLRERECVTLAVPTYASLRLWPESISGLYTETPALARMAHYSSKQRIVLTDAKTVNQQALPLACLYLLAPPGRSDDSISLSPLSRRAACMAIIGNSFGLNLADHRRAAEMLDVTSRIVEHLPVFSLAYPREFARLQEVHQTIMRAWRAVGRRNDREDKDGQGRHFAQRGGEGSG